MDKNFFDWICIRKYSPQLYYIFNEISQISQLTAKKLITECFHYLEKSILENNRKSFGSL